MSRRCLHLKAVLVDVFRTAICPTCFICSNINRLLTFPSWYCEVLRQFQRDICKVIGLQSDQRVLTLFKRRSAFWEYLLKGKTPINRESRPGKTSADYLQAIEEDTEMGTDNENVGKEYPYALTISPKVNFLIALGEFPILIKKLNIFCNERDEARQKH